MRRTAVRKKDLIALCEKHSDSVFRSFTNATLIDEAFADEMLRAQNFIPAISLEGNAYSHDGCRGQGFYDHVVAESDAHSNDLQSPESAEHLCAKCDVYAKNWAEKADQLWECRCPKG